MSGPIFLPQPTQQQMFMNQAHSLQALNPSKIFLKQPLDIIQVLTNKMWPFLFKIWVIKVCIWWVNLIYLLQPQSTWAILLDHYHKLQSLTMYLHLLHHHLPNPPQSLTTPALIPSRQHRTSMATTGMVANILQILHNSLQAEEEVGEPTTARTAECPFREPQLHQASLWGSPRHTSECREEWQPQRRGKEKFHPRLYKLKWNILVPVIEILKFVVEIVSTLKNCYKD